MKSPSMFKMQKARSSLILDQPFFGSLALKTKLIEDEMLYIPNPEQRTMWTDGVSIGYCPAFVDSLPIDQLKGVLCHEVMHLANAHQCRRGERDPQRWNIAADYAVNSIIEASNDAEREKAKRDSKYTAIIVPLPPERLFNSAFTNMEAEAIYNLIPEPPQGPGPGKGNGAGNGPGKQEPNLGDPGKCGEVRDLPGKDGQAASESDKAQNAQDWKIATQQAAQAAKMAGKLPGNLARYVDELLEPVVDWREALRQFIDRTARNDYTWKRPNPRYFSRGLILPSLYNQEMPPLVVAVDTSGSITKDDLQQFASEIDDILNQYPTNVTVIYCDTKVQHVEEFTAETRPIRLDAKGGGGTRFSPVWKWIEENAEETPCAVVYLADLACSDYGNEPEYPTLWVNTGKYQASPPPFGEVVRLKPGH